MTVTGTFLYATGAVRGGIPVKFIPESHPTLDSAGVLSAPSVTATTDTNGAISVTLKQGVFLVQIGVGNDRDKFHIIVPDSNASSDIRSLMVDPDYGVLVYTPTRYLPAAGVNYEFNQSYLSIRNLDTNSYHAIWAVNSPGNPQLQIDPANGGIFPLGLMPRQSLNFRLWNSTLQLLNLTSSRWNTVTLVGAAGVEQIQADEEINDFAISTGFLPIVGANFRLRRNVLQIRNQTQNAFQTIYIAGLSGAEQLQVLPAE